MSKVTGQRARSLVPDFARERVNEALLLYQGVGAAIVPVCGWDLGGGDPINAPDRAAFDAHFDQVMALVRATIGAADHRGVDEEHFGFRWAAWSGVTGLMAVQQSWYDHCPDIQHDQTAVRTEGIDDLLDAYPDVKFLVDAGCRGLAKDHPGQVIARPLKPKKDAPPTRSPRTKRPAKPSLRNAFPPNTPSPRSNDGAPCNAFTGRRDVLPETIRAVVGLASDRAAAR